MQGRVQARIPSVRGRAQVRIHPVQWKAQVRILSGEGEGSNPLSAREGRGSNRLLCPRRRFQLPRWRDSVVRYPCARVKALPSPLPLLFLPLSPFPSLLFLLLLPLTRHYHHRHTLTDINVRCSGRFTLRPSLDRALCFGACVLGRRPVGIPFIFKGLIVYRLPYNLLTLHFCLPLS